MFIHKLPCRCTALLLAVALLLSLTACGGESDATAATMYLRNTEGGVSVTDDSGNDVPVAEHLGLYSGYGVSTRSSSYAWIDLDETKLTKMDEKSRIGITQKGRRLEIEVKVGSLFFNVTEPLQDNETMEIRTSSMLVGIRGTCGWVEASKNGSIMTLFLLEGKVTCTAGGETATVYAGERATMTEDGDIDIAAFNVDAVPGFVRDEIEDDDELAEAIREDAGLDLRTLFGPDAGSGPDGEPVQDATAEQDPIADALVAYRTVVAQADTYYNNINIISDRTFYQYALVWLQPEDSVPTLLLMLIDGDIDYIRVFRYDPESGTALASDTILEEDFVTTSGFYSSISLSADGNGLIDTVFYRGSGDTTISRITFEGTTSHYEEQWEGGFEDPVPEELRSAPIDWHPIEDISALEHWTPSDAPAQQTPGAETPQPAEPEPVSEAALPTDGDRIVLQGTLNEYSAEDLGALQGLSAAEAQAFGGGYTYRILLLDEPQSMTLRSSDPTSNGYSGTVSLIEVSDAGDLSQYLGQHLIFSIDPNQTFWPSDASLPMGQPRTSDVHILA